MTRALWLPAVLRGAGLDVVETPGWQARGVVPRSPETAAQARGELAGIVGHMAHHTASSVRSTLATNLHVVTNGNGVAPGPIAQLMLWRDGVYYVIASGRCNHAGVGSLPWVPGSGNDWLLATEAVNNGIGEPWSPAMVLAYEIGTAAILRHLGLPAARATTHWEWSPGRKIDPAGPNGGRIAFRPGSMTWDPNAWRAAVGRWMLPPPPPEPDPVPPTPETPEVIKMLTIVGNADDKLDPRRWVWDGGTSLRLLTSEAAYRRLLDLEAVGICRFHPDHRALNAPFWMSSAERAEYGQA